MKDTPSVAGRANEHKRIIDSVASKDIRAIVLYGPKYVGKSLILQSMVNEWSADSQKHTVHLDLSDLDSTNLDSATVTDTLNQLAASVVSRLQVAGMKIGDISVRGDDINFWKSICQELPENEKLLLVIDSLKPGQVKLATEALKSEVITASPSTVYSDSEAEVDSFDDDEAAIFESLVQPVMDLDPEKLASKNDGEVSQDQDSSPAAEDSNEAEGAPQNAAEEELYTFLPRLLECEQLKLVLGTDIADPEQLTHYFSKYNHQVRTIQVNLLSKDDTEKVLHSEDMEGLVNWNDKSALDRVWSLTHGHPAFISAVSSAVSDDIFQDIGELERAKRIKGDMIDEALPKVLEKVEPIAEWHWENLSKAEQIVLTIIAYMQPGVVSADTIALAINDIELSQLVWGVRDERFQVGIKLSQVNLSEILVKFQQLNLVEQIGNLYSIPISLMREWIVDNHEPPEDYVRLIRKASMQNIGHRPETLSGGLIRYVPGSSQSKTGRNVTVAVLVLLLVGALLSLPFLARTFGFEELTTYIPSWMLPSQNVSVADAASVVEESKPTGKEGDTGPADATDEQVALNQSTNGTQDTGKASTSEASDSSVAQNNLAKVEPEGETSNSEIEEAAPSQESVPTAKSKVELNEATITLQQELLINDMIWNLAINMNDELIAAGLESGIVSVWDIAESDESQLQVELEGHTKEVLAVAFNPADPAVLASASADNTIRIWDVESGETLHALNGHTDEIGALAFHPEGKMLASGSADKTIQLWNIDTGELIATLGGENEWVLTVAFSPDGTQLASGTIDGTIQIWDVVNLTKLDTLEAHKDWVSSLAFSPISGELASASYDENVYVWSVGERRFAPPTDAEAGLPTGTVNSIAFHPNGQYLIGGQHDGTLLVWNLANPKNVSTLDGHLDAVRSAVFSPQGGLIATGALDGKIRLWQVDVE